MGMLPITTNTSDELFSRIKIDDEMARDRLTVYEQESFARLVSISSNFLF